MQLLNPETVRNIATDPTVPVAAEGWLKYRFNNETSDLRYFMLKKNLLFSSPKKGEKVYNIIPLTQLKIEYYSGMTIVLRKGDVSHEFISQSPEVTRIWVVAFESQLGKQTAAPVMK